MISIQVLCHAVDLKHGFVTSWENVLFTLENIGTCVKITWNYFLCLVLHKVNIDYAQGMVQIVDFYIDDFIFALYLHERRQFNDNGSEIIGPIWNTLKVNNGV